MESLLAVFRTTNHILQLSLAGLPERTARIRTRGHEGPSIAWTVGHLLDSRVKILALLGDVRKNPWAAKFDDTPATDGDDYPPLESMVEAWDELQTALEAAAVRANSALEHPLQTRGVHGESKLRQQLAFLAWHEGYHVGVIGALRKSAGLPGPAELAIAASRAA